MRTRFFSFCIAMMMVLSLTACGDRSTPAESGESQPTEQTAEAAESGESQGTEVAESSGEPVNIKIGTVMSETAPAATALVQMQEELKEKSGGRINVEIYFGSQLGGELEMIEQVRGGDIQMATSNHMNISNTITPLAALESYFLFEDYDHAFRFQDSEGGLAMLDAYQEMGMQGMGYFPNGFRQFTNSKLPITGKDDLKGIKIRGYSEVQIAAWESVGAVLSTVAWGEVFTSLQQKLIDGQECAISSIYEQKFYEVQKYVSLTSHLLSSDILVCNQAWMEGLDPADQEMITTAVQNAVAFHRENFVSLEDDYIEEFKANGTEINELDPAARQELSDVMNAAVNPTIINLSGQEAFDLVQKWAAETK